MKNLLVDCILPGIQLSIIIEKDNAIWEIKLFLNDINIFFKTKDKKMLVHKKLLFHIYSEKIINNKK